MSPTVVVVIGSMLFVYVKCNELPRNTAVVVGTDALLECAQSRPYRWYKYKSTDPSKEDVVYMGTQIADLFLGRFRVYKIKDNRLDLSIANVHSSDWGMYKCQVYGSASCAELIVLDFEPICEVHRQQQQQQQQPRMVELRCRLNISSNGAPEMRCSDNDEGVAMPASCSERTDNTTASNVTCTTSVPEEKKGKYTCVIKINHRARSSSAPCTAATNAPDYTYTWHSSSSGVDITTTPDTNTENKPLAQVFKSCESESHWLMLIVGLPTAGLVIVVLIIVTLHLACRNMKVKDERYQRKTLETSTDNRYAEPVYTALAIQHYEEIPAEAPYIAANPDFVRAPYMTTI